MLILTAQLIEFLFDLQNMFDFINFLIYYSFISIYYCIVCPVIVVCYIRNDIIINLTNQYPATITKQ